MSKSIIAAIVLYLASVVSATAQQQHTQAEIIEALSMKINVLQQSIDQMYLLLAKKKSEQDEVIASAKWVLDNWVPKPVGNK